MHPLPTAHVPEHYNSAVVQGASAISSIEQMCFKGAAVCTVQFSNPAFYYYYRVNRLLLFFICVHHPAVCTAVIIV